MFPQTETKYLNVKVEETIMSKLLFKTILGATVGFALYTLYDASKLESNKRKANKAESLQNMKKTLNGVALDIPSGTPANPYLIKQHALYDVEAQVKKLEQKWKGVKIEYFINDESDYDSVLDSSEEKLLEVQYKFSMIDDYDQSVFDSKCVMYKVRGTSDDE